MAVVAKLPGYLWIEVINTTNYIVNRSPTSANLGKTLEERYTGKIPNVTHLKIFGSIAFVYIPKTDRKKLDTKTQKCIFLGYDTESKVYRIYSPNQKKVILTRDVTIDETQIGFHYLSEKDPAPVTYLPSQLGDMPEINPPAHSQPSQSESAQTPTEFPDLSQNPQASSPTHSPLHPTQLNDNSQPSTIPRPSSESPPTSRRNPKRRRELPKHFRDYWLMPAEILDEPLTFTEASAHSGWTEAMQQEIKAIMKNHTWELVDRPDQKVPITAKWIYKLKKDTNVVVTKLKARIVARGFQQTEGVTFSEIFAPVVRWSTIRTILALAASHSWPIHQMDVITTFLNGELTYEVYMEVPEGFPGAGDPTKICHLKRALYGLRQAPRVWYDKINTWLQQQNLRQSDSDPNLFYSLENG